MCVSAALLADFWQPFGRACLPTFYFIFVAFGGWYLILLEYHLVVAFAVAACSLLSVTFR